jgi:hypothetical protein
MIHKLMLALANAGIIPDGELIDLGVKFVSRIKKRPVEERLPALKKALRDAMDDAPRVYEGQLEDQQSKGTK